MKRSSVVALILSALISVSAIAVVVAVWNLYVWVPV